MLAVAGHAGEIEYDARYAAAALRYWKRGGFLPTSYAPDTRVIRSGFSATRVWFGVHKGRLLNDLSNHELTSLRAWLRRKGDDLGWKMWSFLGYVEKELNSRDS